GRGEESSGNLWAGPWNRRATAATSPSLIFPTLQPFVLSTPEICFSCAAPGLPPLVRPSTLPFPVPTGRVSNITINHPPEAIEGKLISLHCMSRGDNVSYSWTKGGQVVRADGRISLKNNNQTLELNPGYRNDTADYICHGNNSISSNQSEPYHLDIICKSDLPVLSHGMIPEYLTFFLGAQIKLTCKAVVHPPAVYTWFYNGTELDNRIFFLKISPEYSGNYTCSVINPISFLKRDATLGINMKRRILTPWDPPPPYFTSNGGTFGALRLPAITPPVLLENNSQTLTLLSTSRSDAASYTCSGKNSFSANSSEPHRLEIFYGPEHPVISPLQQVYNEHSILNLVCSAVSNPPAKFSWYLNGELLEHQNDSHLTQRLTLKNAGNYTCKVTNVESGLSKATVLEISIRGPGKIVENSTTYLNCTASGFNVSYYWLKGNQRLQAGGHISLSTNGQNLILSRTRRQDSGLYTCCGINSFSNNSANYKLNVFYGPDAPVISPSGQFYAEGSNLTLSCQADSNPPAEYTWSFKNSRHSGGIYQLFRLSSANNGTYTCEASNNETKLSQSKVQPICVLAPPPPSTTPLGVLTGVVSTNDPA
uniref:Ig-like domain-containing protein n=1 Tax=Pseudonaja textilis TaxID=8673 RepID=A0A670ZYD4_PSETE